VNVHVGNHLRLLQASETVFAGALERVAARHADQPDVPEIARQLAAWSTLHAKALDPLLKRYRGVPATSPRILSAVLFKGPRKHAIGLLRDLQDLAILAHSVHGTWTVVDQMAAALRDAEMKGMCDRYISETKRQIQWLDSQIKAIAPQALTVLG
jgi:hypothetical protein